MGSLDNICPECGYELDSYVVVGEKENLKPKEHDLSFCIKCGKWAQFNRKLKLIKVSKKEIDELPSDVKLFMEKVYREWKEYRKTIN